MGTKYSKRILQHPLTQRTLCTLVAGYIKLVYATMRQERHIHADAAPYMEGKANAIFGFWHGRLMLMAAFHPPGRAMHVLVSEHNDGVLIAKTVAHFGVETIHGSSSKGGSAALRTLLRSLRAGANVGITPDGPRGPARKLEPGILYAAKASGKPILPVTFAASHYKKLSSWDAFVIPYPFARIAFYIGAPLHIEKTMTEADARSMVEAAMNQLTEQADASMRAA